MGYCSDERGKISDLVEFIGETKLSLREPGSSLPEDKFDDLMEIISNYPPVFFKVYENVDGIVHPQECCDVEQIVPYLFDKIELGRWKITFLEYLRFGKVSYDNAYDLVEIWISNRKQYIPHIMAHFQPLPNISRKWQN